MNLRDAGMRLGLAVAIAGWCPTAAQISYRVGTAEALRGQKANGFIEVPKGVDAAIGIPLVVVNGARPGPVLALVAGAHGTEYASIVALERVAAVLDPSQLSGTVVVIPLLNTASFEQRVPHLNPVGGKNMNRFYPGKADGTQTERAAPDRLSRRRPGREPAALYLLGANGARGAGPHLEGDGAGVRAEPHHHLAGPAHGPGSD